ncbi:MAG: transcription termination factor Rho [Eubacterium sp.]|nr:transcription termination factor Rho [Eubacterium sp.]
MDYAKMKVSELRELAEAQGLRNLKGVKKSELVELLKNIDKMKSQNQVEKTGRITAEAANEGASAAQERPVADKSERVDKSEHVDKAESFEQPEVEGKEVERTDGASQSSAPQEVAEGILEVLSDGYGFIRSDNYMPGDRDIYVSPSQIRKFRLRTGDIVRGPIRGKSAPNEKFSALLYIESVNGYSPEEILKRMKFEDMTPIFPDERIHLDYEGAPVSLRIVDLFSPIGKGQRGMIVSPPKAGKTTLLKQIAKRISKANPEMNLLVLLIDERPEEVTDIKESIEGPNAEVIYSTFDELPDHHKRVSEMVIERAKRLVESGNDVVILIDSITRLARAYNLTITPSGRTLSGGLDPAALHMPKKFFGAARNMREGGSLTILATALIETGSRLDDVVFEEFKGTGNMELVLDRDLQEKRVFPAIDISKSGTRKDDLLLSKDEREVCDMIHRRFHSLKAEDVTEDLLKIFAQTKDNKQFVGVARKLFQRH